MRRTQLFLDEDLWRALHARAIAEHTTVSALVRNAARERYLGELDERGAAMRAAVGIRKTKPRDITPEEEIRALRKGSRLERLAAG